MSKKKRILDNKWWAAALLAVAALFVIFANRLGNIGFGEQALFLAAQVAFVLIPGMALVVCVNPPENRLILVIVSYMAGYALNIALYFLFCAVGLADHLLVCMAVVAAISVLLIWRKRNTLREMKTDHAGAWIVTIMLAALLAGVLFQSVANYNTPDFTGSDAVYIYQDLNWNVGNTTAVANGLPVMDIHMDGVSLGYHYFSNVFAAMYRNILGTTSYLMYIKLLPVVQVLFFAGGFYMLFSTLFKNKWKVLLGCVTGMLCSIHVMMHMFWFSYATAIALGMSLAAAYYLIRFIKKMETAKWYDRDFIMFLILLMAIAGTKIMYAAPCLAGFAILALVQMLRKKNVLHTLAALAVMIVAFGVVYLLTSYGIHAFNQFQFAFAQAVADDPLYHAARGALPAISTGMTKLLVYPLFAVKYYLPLVAAAVVLFVWLLRSRGKDNKLKIFLFAAIVICFAAASVLFQPGLSNTMFISAAMPLCAYALIYALREILQSGAKKISKILFCILLAAVFVYQGQYALSSLYGQAKESERLRHDHAGIAEQNLLHRDEYEGMIWLRDNTPKDSVFAADRQLYSDIDNFHYARYYYYTAFSERQCYLEGYGYTYTYEADFEQTIAERRAVLDGVYRNDPAALQRLTDDGVDYLVVSGRVHPDFELEQAYGELVFENEGIAIYALY